MSKTDPSSTPGSAPQPRLSRRSCLLIVPVAAGAILLLVAAALIVRLVLRSDVLSDLFGQEASPGMPVEVIKLTPDISTSPLTPPSCETIISSGDVQVAVSLPISLTLGGESFPIVPILPGEDMLTQAAGKPGTAAWVCGTVVNYVVVMEPTPGNETLLTNLRPGDEIRMHLSNGLVLLFRFVERRETAANEASVFEQIRPRLTVILEREDGTWQTATSDYVAETEPVEPPDGTLVQLGTPARVGDAQLTAIKGYAERSGPDLSPGTMYYLLEFSVENVGASPLDTTAFNMQLQDSAGNTYLLSPAASAAGEHGLPAGEIAPGASVQATAGYLVPETLAGPTLTWTFSPWPGSELRASVSIPYEASTEPAAVAQAEVNITDAFLSSDGGVLIIEGEVQNVGEAPLTVELSNIRLTSSAGMSDLRMAAPPLPWTVEPGNTQVIELQYTKPDAPVALLALLGYSFEVQGLQ